MKEGRHKVSYFEVIKRDLRMNKVIDRHARMGAVFVWKHVLFGLMFRPNFSCVFWYRVNRLMHLRGLPGKNLLSVWRMYQFGNDISYLADIGPGFRLIHISDIVIGSRVKIGSDAMIGNGVTIGAKSLTDPSMPTIGNGVYIGTGAKLLGGISIGDYVTIGALSLINKPVPSDTMVYGIPPNVRSKDNVPRTVPAHFSVE